MEKEGEERLASYYDGSTPDRVLPHCDLFKGGHHGSKTSSSEEFINEINPKYSIISVGKDNYYKHPNREVLEVLKNSKNQENINSL